MSNFTSVLQQQAKIIANACPREWDRFVEIFDAYATEVTITVTQAGQHEVLNQQGKAQAFLHLLKTFRECRNPPKPQSPPP